MRNIICTIACASLLVCSISHGGQAEGWRKKQPSSGAVVALNPLNPATVLSQSTGGGQDAIIVSYDHGETWSHLHADTSSPAFANIRQLLVHPADTLTIFCADDSGLHKSSDGGATWRTVLPNYIIDGESIEIDPLHPDTIYAAESIDGKLYRSTDRGEHWPDSSLSVNSVSTLSLRPDNTKILYAGTGLGSISKSTDGGKSWRIVKHTVPGSGVSLKVEKISISPTFPLTAYAAFNGNIDTSIGVWKTTNGGEFWFRTNTPALSFFGMEIDPSDPGTVYAGTGSGSAAAIYRTTDGGTSWSPMTVGLPANGSVNMVKIHPLDPLTKWASASYNGSGTGGVHRYGLTGTIISGMVLNSVTSAPVMNGFIVTSPVKDSIDLGSSGGHFSFYRFDGDPDTVYFQTQTYPYYSSSQNVSFLSGVESAQNILLQELPKRAITGMVTDSSNGGPRRALLHIHGTTSIGVTDYSDSSAADGYFHFDSLYITYPPVNNYDYIHIAPDLPYGYQRINSVSLDTNGTVKNIRLTVADVFIIAANDSTTYTPYYRIALDSLGVTYNIWDQASRGTAPMRTGAVLRKKTIIYYTGSSHAPLPASDVDSLTSALDAGCRLYLTGQDIAEKNDTTALMRDYLRTGFQANSLIIYVTGTNGDIFNALGFNTVYFGASNQTSRDILIPLDSKVRPVIGYGYGNLGTAAVRIDSVRGGGRAIVMGFGFEAISEVDMRQKVMRNVIGYLDGTLVIDAVEDGNDPAVPQSYSISQNYPNPFNPVTQIRYGIPEAGHVELAIYDLLGRKIATLADEHHLPGFSTVSWDASLSASGAYFYRIVAMPDRPGIPAYIRTKMMMLVK